MRIAFVAANRENMPDAVIPLGLLYVMESAPPHHERILIDLCFEADPLEHLTARLAGFRPDLIALGMRNIQSNDYAHSERNLIWYDRCVATLRRVSNAPLVVGGGGFTVMPAALMRRLRPDFGIAGEGERPFARLLELLEAGVASSDGLRQIPRMHFFDPDNGELVSVPEAGSFQKLDELAAPDRSILDRRYFSEYGTDSVQTKRGCPLGCRYCTYPRLEGRALRQRDPARVVDELFAAREGQPDLKHVFFVDAVFNLPARHAKQICREMIRRGYNVPWTAYANPIGFDAELADLMREAGCAGLEIGSDSGCDAILARLRKGFSTQQIRAIHRKCVAAGLPDCHAFLLGTEGETLADVRRTLDFVTDLDPYAAILMVWTDDQEALGSEANDGNHAPAEARREVRESILELLRAAKDDFPRWIIPPVGTNFDARLFARLRRRGLTGPLWQHLQRKGRDLPGERVRRLFHGA
ncbi:MAG: radical SAM protein [Myxococcales bacterium]|nr:radical SAM protein [Myxococcales bacterium]MDH5566188.1 radical SAM protein [Myxococcales bacterium]